MRGARLLGVLAALGAAVVLAAPAYADGASPNSNVALVRGAAPLPQFNAPVPFDLGLSAPLVAPKDDLEISLTSHDHSVLRFLFSPHTLSGQALGIGNTGASYSGLSWNIFDSDKLYSTITLSSAASRLGMDDPTRRLYGPLMSVHSTIELGYAIGPQQSLSFVFDHADPAPYSGDRLAFGEYLRLRYGYHF